jgi:hypothetical protein
LIGILAAARTRDWQEDASARYHPWLGAHFRFSKWVDRNGVSIDDLAINLGKACSLCETDILIVAATAKNGRSTFTWLGETHSRALVDHFITVLFQRFAVQC